MTDFVREIEDRFPSPDEVDAILEEARQMRAQSIRDGAISFWSLLQRVVTPKRAAARTRHA